MDIAPTALGTARARNPRVSFVAMDVRNSLAFDASSFDLVVYNELLWFVLPDLQRLFSEVQRIWRTGGLVLIKQHFHQPGEQRYGNEVMENPGDLIGWLLFPVVRTIEVDRGKDWFVVLLAEIAKP